MVEAAEAGQQQRQSQIILQGTSFNLFIEAIRSPQTKIAYKNSIKRYMNHLKITDIDNLLLHNSSKIIESQIIDYIMSLRKDGISYSTIRYLIAPIFTFYQLNDIVLNRKKVSRYLGEFKRVVKDKPYSTEQIQTALTNADQRMRMMILILSSTGCRIGSLTDLTLGNLTKKPEYNLYKIVFYEGTNNEYYTFCTRECAITGIEPYLEFRKRCGERLEFNKVTQQWTPEDAPLFRTQFDYNDSLQARRPQKMNTHSIRSALASYLIKIGLRHCEKTIAPISLNRIRKSIPLANGFRKRAISIFIECQLNHEIRELIVDHDTHLDQNYYRPSEEQVLNEYLKAEQALTIDPTLKMQQEIQTLRVEKSKIESLEKDMSEFKEVLKQFMG